jgi:hypothetical protein
MSRVHSANANFSCNGFFSVTVSSLGGRPNTLGVRGMARNQRVLEGRCGRCLYTYSTYGRGVEVMMGTYRLLDLTPKGRDERDTFYKMEWVRRPRPLRTGIACESYAGGRLVLHGARLTNVARHE